MKVSNITNSNGNKVPNQFLITGNGDVTFQSYESTILKITGGQVYLDTYYWDYSKTTSKYRNHVLRETTKETQAKINSGEYILTELNYD
jgi:hypothetical protein